MGDVFRALADPSRRELLDRLNQRNGQTLRDLCDGLGMTRQSVSKHLAVLADANLVATQRQGRETLHYLNPVPIHAIAERWIRTFDRPRVSALADLKLSLENPVMSDRFLYVTYIATTPDKAWVALTDPAFTRRYWGVELISDWQAGSHVTWTYGGATMDGPRQVVLEADPPRRLSYTWHEITPEFLAVVEADPDWIAAATAEHPSRVTFEIEPVGDLVKLTVTHDDFTPDSVILPGISEGWPSILASLKTLLETGEPLSFA